MSEAGGVEGRTEGEAVGEDPSYSAGPGMCYCYAGTFGYAVIMAIIATNGSDSGNDDNIVKRRRRAAAAMENPQRERAPPPTWRRRKRTSGCNVPRTMMTLDYGEVAEHFPGAIPRNGDAERVSEKNLEESRISISRIPN